MNFHEGIPSTNHKVIKIHSEVKKKTKEASNFYGEYTGRIYRAFNNSNYYSEKNRCDNKFSYTILTAYDYHPANLEIISYAFKFFLKKVGGIFFLLMLFVLKSKFPKKIPHVHQGNIPCEKYTDGKGSGEAFPSDQTRPFEASTLSHQLSTVQGSESDVPGC